MDGRTHTPSYRDTMMHLKTLIFVFRYTLGGIVSSFVPPGQFQKLEYLRVSCFDSKCFMEIRICIPAQPTYQPKVKIWYNFGNFWLIELIFGIWVHFT